MFPLNRLYLSTTLAEPALTAEAVYYVRIADGKRHIVQHHLETGLAHPLTTEPAPAGGVGYGNGFFARHAETLVYAARTHLVGLNTHTGRQWRITPDYEGVAAPAISPDGRFVAFMAEQGRAANVLLVDIQGEHTPARLTDNPWYAFNPVFSPDGTRLAWQTWREADMPWDESALHVAQFAQPCAAWAWPAHALPLTITTLAQAGVSFGSPQFSPDARHLAFTSDQTGWRNLWVAEASGANPVQVDTGPGEVGKPDWVPGQFAARWRADSGALFAVRRHHSQDTLVRVDWPQATVTELPTPFTEIVGLNVHGEALAFIAANPTTPHALYTLHGEAPVKRATTSVGVWDSAALAPAEVIRWPTADGSEVTGILFRATGPQAQTSIDDEAAPRRIGFAPSAPANSGVRRPLIVHIHGGPTSETPLTWSAQAHYFATRGWHYLWVNHRGGTGYGRAFQEKLNGQWGVVDVEDARSGAEHLIAQGLADPARVVLTGGSAGGYTTLMALTHDPHFWAAGVALYGIGNLYDLKQGSHRFEVNYEERLIGPLPQAGKLWKARSPLTFVGKVRAPVLLFHGTEDKAVPHQQSVEFAEAVRRQGGVAQMVSYAGEGHGFGREANRRDLIEKMEAFLERYVICQQA